MFSSKSVDTGKQKGKMAVHEQAGHMGYLHGGQLGVNYQVGQENQYSDWELAHLSSTGVGDRFNSWTGQQSFALLTSMDHVFIGGHFCGHQSQQEGSIIPLLPWDWALYFHLIMIQKTFPKILCRRLTPSFAYLLNNLAINRFSSWFLL